MNTFLLGAASLGALIVFFTSDRASIDAARAAADDAEVERLMEAAPDQGSMQDVTILDPKTGEETTAKVLAFRS